MTRKPRQQKRIPQQFRKRKKKHCIFCVEQKGMDYKDVLFMRRFITDRGKIGPRRSTGCCALHQRMVGKRIKRARQMGLVPYVVD